MKTLLYETEKECCGCGACENICPKAAITMKKNECGFLYPYINESKCVECGLCMKVCKFKDEPLDRVEEQTCYAFSNNNPDELLQSSSGGAFLAIVDAVYELHGERVVTFGATMNSKMHTIHKEAVDRQAVNAFCSSKYVQSDMNDCFKQVEKRLNDGMIVLYTGTPCQIDAVRSYIRTKNINEKNFYAVDLICHGTPSPGLWNDYIQWLEKRFGKIKEFSFRYKKVGWEGYNTIARFENGKERINDKYTQIFTNIFSTDKALRESCYSCPYANMNRTGDLTIGDYWGGKKILQKEIAKGVFSVDKGISEIIVNTEKGIALMEVLKAKNTCIISKTNEYIQYQPNLRIPTLRPEETDKFWKEYKQRGSTYIINRYGKKKFKVRLKEKLKKYRIIKQIHSCIKKIKK